MKNFCDGCHARLMFVRFRAPDGTFGGSIPCDPTVDLGAGVTPTIAWEFAQAFGRRIRVGHVITAERPRDVGMRLTTAHPATCSAARRQNVPANERPVGEADMTNDPTLFDPIPNA